MNAETAVKLEKLKALLKKGYSLKEAIRKVVIGWKTYYMYEIEILADPEVPLPKKRIKRLIERWFPFKIDSRKLLLLLWEISRQTALELLIRKKRRLLYANEFHEFQQVADQLLMKWSQEIAEDFYKFNL